MRKRKKVRKIVLVPIFKPSAQSREVGKEIAKQVRAGEGTTPIGQNLAKQIKETLERVHN
jgi:hypothetical protein